MNLELDSRWHVTPAVTSQIDTSARRARWLAIAFLLLGFGVIAGDGISRVWTQRINPAVGGGAFDYPMAMARGASGDFAAVGYSWEPWRGEQRVLLTFAATNGAPRWGVFPPPENAADNRGQLVAVAFAANGDVLAAGRSWGSLGPHEFFIGRYSGATGDRLWERRYGGEFQRSAGASWLEVDSNGDVLVTGHLTDLQGRFILETLKVSGSDGAQIWERRHLGRPLRGGFPVGQALDSAGNVVVAGFADTETTRNLYVVKYSGVDGATLWEHRGEPAAGGDAISVSLQIDPLDHAVVSHTVPQTGGGTTPATVKLDGSDGRVLWRSVSASRSGEVFASTFLSMDESGDVYLAASRELASQRLVYLCKYSSLTGETRWEKDLSDRGGRLLSPAALRCDRGDVSVLLGVAAVPSGDPVEFRLQRLVGSDGRVLWGVSDGVLRTSPTYPIAMVHDLEGNPVVLGMSNYQWFYSAFDRASGFKRWERRFQSPSDLLDTGLALTFTPAGDVATTGISHNGHDLDTITTLYSRTEGRVLWSKPLAGTAKLDDVPNALAVDASGDLFLAARLNMKTDSLNVVVTNLDQVLIKYSGRDGSPLWEWKKNVARDDWVDFRLDRNGDALVSGIQGGVPYLCKRSGRDGSLMWERRELLEFFQRSIEVDPEDDLIIVGAFSGRSIVRRYSGKTGERLWEFKGTRRARDLYTEPGPRGLAFTPGGDLVLVGVTWSGIGSESDVPSVYLARLALSTGLARWESWDERGMRRGEQVAVDSNGDVVVTGYAQLQGLFGVSEFFVTKYVGTSGAPAWDQIYGTDNQTDDYARGLRIRPDGDVVVHGWRNVSPIAWQLVTLRLSGATGRVQFQVRDTGSWYLSPSVYGRSWLMSFGPGGCLAITGSDQPNSAATVLYRDAEDPPRLEMGSSGTGLKFRFPGWPGEAYEIERAASAGGSWSWYASVELDPDGNASFEAAEPQRDMDFYRVKVTPAASTWASPIPR